MRFKRSTMKKALLLSTLLFFGCAEFRPSWVSEDSWVPQSENPSSVDSIDGPQNGHFDDEGNWIPDNSSIEWTYKIPDISAGFLFDANSIDFTPSIQVEIVEFDIPFLSLLDTWKFDLGVAYQRAYFYAGPLITSIFEISAGLFCGWNWEDEEISYGLGFTIIKF